MHTYSMHDFIMQDITAIWSFSKLKYLQLEKKKPCLKNPVDYDKNNICLKENQKREDEFLEYVQIKH